MRLTALITTVLFIGALPAMGSAKTKSGRLRPREHQVWVTFYSDRGITASGQKTRDGIAAANFLPLGTKIKIPKLFGDKIFVVKDRMHPRKKRYVDVWVKSRKKAILLGKQRGIIVVVGKTKGS